MRSGTSCQRNVSQAHHDVPPLNSREYALKFGIEEQFHATPSVDTELIDDHQDQFTKSNRTSSP
jgi:hypothetical protein